MKLSTLTLVLGLLAPAAAFGASYEVDAAHSTAAFAIKHLKSPDFFDVAKYPKITYVSKSVKAIDAGHLEVTGDLTLHGVTKPVVLKVSDLSPELVSSMDKKSHRGATATGTINRQDFGLKWNAPATGKAGDVVLGDDVKIQIDVELVKKVATK